MYSCAVRDEEIRNEINVGKYRIIPVQNGTLCPITEVFIEKTGIDDYFKDLCESIDRYLRTNERIRIREILVDKQLDTEKYEGMEEFQISRLEQHLKYGTRNSILSTEVPAVRRRLAAAIEDDRAYDVYKFVDSRIPERYTPQLKLSHAVWDNTMIWMQNVIREYFNKYNGKYVNFQDEENLLTHIDIINFNCEIKGRFDSLSSSSGPIITEHSDGRHMVHIISYNQRDFAKIQDIDDLMITIYHAIVTDGVKLIDRRIKLDRSMLVDEMNEFKAATLVSNKITSELNEGALHTKPSDFQAACSLLLRWINQHEDRAKELFPLFWSKEKRMQLLTAEQAALLSENLDAFESLMKKYGVKTMEELEQKLKKYELLSRGR